MQNQTKETASTEQKPDFQVLLHAISSCSSVAVRQILNLDPSLVQCKGKLFCDNYVYKIRAVDNGMCQCEEI